MRTHISFYLSFCLVTSCFFIQAQPVDGLLRGPQNITSDMGVVDGVVVKDEVPVRSHVEYEYVRLADYAWSKRLFSRIDGREKVNQPLFYPFDFIDIERDFIYPSNFSELQNNPAWIRNQERFSLWTIIQMHLMNGDLTMFKVNSSAPGVEMYEDGYHFKYPIKINFQDDFYKNNNNYRDEIIKYIAAGNKPVDWFVVDPSGTGQRGLAKSARKSQTFNEWVDSLTNKSNQLLLSDVEDGEGGYFTVYNELNFIMKNGLSEKKNAKSLENAWNNAGPNEALVEPPSSTLVPSKSITAYNIKEDWFFDKERSMLDKRIIAIAPVTRYRVELPVGGKESELNRYLNVVLVGEDGNFMAYDDKGLLGELVLDETKHQIEEREMFWLYFPELRKVLVNYYVYNNQSDAQWMSFDDFFWKRMFSAQIYRSSDQFDRNVEDYRYGVDALYEAEKIKETMRTWETDLWNY